MKVNCSELTLERNCISVMRKYIVCLCLCLGSVGSVFSQSRQDTLLVVPAKTGLYVYHVVAKGETLYSLSRKFRLEPRQLASFNGMTLKSPLKLYQLLKIPLTTENLDQSAGAGQASGGLPLYHKVTKGETLYHLGQLYHKVPATLLREWNHLSDNSVKVGQYVVIGWLNTGAENSANLATQQEVKPDSPAVPPQETPAEPVAAAAPSAPAKETPAASAAPAPEGGGFLSEVIASENQSRRQQSTKAGSPGASAPTRHRETTAQASEDAFTVQAPVKPAAHASAPAGAASVEAPSVATAQADKPGPETPLTAPTPAEESVPDSGAAPTEEPPHVAVAPSEEPAAAAPGESNPANIPQPDSGSISAGQARSAPQVNAEPEPADSFALMLDRVTHRGAPAASGTPPAQEVTPAPGSQDQTADQPATDRAVENPLGAPVDQPVGDSAVENPLEEVPVKSAFAQAFAEQTGDGQNLVTRKGAAGWFRSNVKPGSGRYYALCDDLPRGTIVKVSNPINQKSVLVKILDVIPKQKENYNLIIKLSDAAMGDLGVSQSRFWCEISYAKSDKH